MIFRFSFLLSKNGFCFGFLHLLNCCMLIILLFKIKIGFLIRQTNDIFTSISVINCYCFVFLFCNFTLKFLQMASLDLTEIAWQFVHNCYYTLWSYPAVLFIINESMAFVTQFSSELNVYSLNSLCAKSDSVRNHTICALKQIARIFRQLIACWTIWIEAKIV